MGNAKAGEGSSGLEAGLGRLDDFEGVGGREGGDGLVSKGKRASEGGDDVFLFGELFDALHIHVGLESADDVVEEVVGLGDVCGLLGKGANLVKLGLLSGEKDGGAWCESKIDQRAWL